MTEAALILKMIEEVDPADTAKLDEIDAHVYEFMDWPESDIGLPEYTRSRDALKAIRPGGWQLNEISEWVTVGWSCSMVWVGRDSTRIDAPTWPRDGSDPAFHLPTEELAELHAIIQAIAYERQHQ